jgi:hypothetical protein
MTLRLIVSNLGQNWGTGRGKYRPKGYLVGRTKCFKLKDSAKGIGWRQRVGSRARVRLAIEDALDDGLPRAYSKEVFETKCSAVFEHVYESYQGEGKSVYAHP